MSFYPKFFMGIGTLGAMGIGAATIWPKAEAQPTTPPGIFQVASPTPATPAPTPTPTLPVKVTKYFSPLPAGSEGFISVNTAPGAQCIIYVIYPSGHGSEAAGLDDHITDTRGNASWSWTVGTRTNPGTGEIDIYCNKGGVFGSVKVPIEVE